MLNRVENLQGQSCGAPGLDLAGERKDRPLMGLRPVFLNPRTLVRTWGTRSELV
jgi:hypothetical protein